MRLPAELREPPCAPKDYRCLYDFYGRRAAWYKARADRMWRWFCGAMAVTIIALLINLVTTVAMVVGR